MDNLVHTNMCVCTHPHAYVNTSKIIFSEGGAVGKREDHGLSSPPPPPGDFIS